eukprot:160562-Alexandrium_andersonii.AAC.1
MRRAYLLPKTAFATYGAARGLTRGSPPPGPLRLAPPAHAASPGRATAPQIPRLAPPARRRR